MKVKVLMENTKGREDLCCEHGLSLYIETKKHKLLFDAGQSESFAENAKKMGVDLNEVDTVILSHGHYDHGGGLQCFMSINDKAPVYLNRNAFVEHLDSTSRDIGIDGQLKNNERLIFVDDMLEIDEELTLYSCNEKERPFGSDSGNLMMKHEGKIVQDDFRHEHYLLIKEDDKKILISGCSHKGILNIVNWFDADVFIGGFHIVNVDPEGEGRKRLEQVADELLSYPTKYYTGHCTGTAQYAFLKDIMKDKLEYLSTGTEFEI